MHTSTSRPATAARSSPSLRPAATARSREPRPRRWSAAWRRSPGSSRTPRVILTLNFTSGSLTRATSDAVVVSAAAATQLVVTTPPPSTLVAGQSFTVAVSAEDPDGNVHPSFGGNVTVSLPGGSGPAVTVQAKDGVATFAGLTPRPTAQGGSIQATAGGLTPRHPRRPSTCTPTKILPAPHDRRLSRP